MKLTKDSRIVKVWVTLVMADTYSIDKVPTFFGLRDVVQEVLDEMQATEE